jgi:hypothetical protein
MERRNLELEMFQHGSFQIAKFLDAVPISKRVTPQAAEAELASMGEM